jgi:hypothetical protein
MVTLTKTDLYTGLASDPNSYATPSNSAQVSASSENNGKRSPLAGSASLVTLPMFAASRGAAPATGTPAQGTTPANDASPQNMVGNMVSMLPAPVITYPPGEPSQTSAPTQTGSTPSADAPTADSGGAKITMGEDGDDKKELLKAALDKSPEKEIEPV